MCSMYCCYMNLANVSEENGGLLSVENLLGGPLVEEGVLTEGVCNEEILLSCCGEKSLLQGLARVLLECLWVTLDELLALPCVWYISCSFLHIQQCPHPYVASRFVTGEVLHFFYSFVAFMEIM